MTELALVRRYDMLPAGSRVLCAVSGGADSMCLLHLLWSRRQELGIQVLAAHYEHGLRGEEALRDAEFVDNWCRERGITCVLEHGDVPAYAREHGLGTEEAARELRYAFLDRAAAAMGCDRIATAHNADDNAETILFNLCRGSGTAGLRGIPPARGNIIRPLLDKSRAEIEAYLKENAVPHVEDSTNADDDYSRNLIRHRIMPVLREINPAFSAAAGRTGELLRRDEACLEALAENFISRFYDGESVPAAQLGALPEAVASRVLLRLCGKKLSMTHVEAALALTEGSGLKYVDLPGFRIRREQGRIYFSERTLPAMPDVVIRPGASVSIPERGITVRTEWVEYRSCDKEINGLFKTCFFKSESICGKLLCGGRRPGDRLRPAGRGCTKSLKGLFAEAGLTQYERDSLLVFRDEAGILAVPGLAVDERASARPGDRALRIDILKR